MNIIEAIKSGRRFRHKSWQDWHTAVNNPMESESLMQTPIAHQISDDWEVEEVSCYAGSAMITREQFDAAWSKLWPYDAYNDSLNSINCYTKLERDALAKELGI